MDILPFKVPTHSDLRMYQIYRVGQVAPSRLLTNSCFKKLWCWCRYKATSLIAFLDVFHCSGRLLLPLARPARPCAGAC